MPPLARVALAAIAGFLVGFGWQYVGARGLERRLSDTTRDLQLARTEAMLAVAVTDAQRGDFERARRQASDFYTQAQRSVTAAKVAAGRNANLPAAEEALRRVLQERDATIALLSRSDSAGSTALARQLTAYRGALHGVPAADPGSGTTASPAPAKS